ncbi:hypothetical protein [Terribacillus saccharophilus]|nr:hypothetical protein [Terribacillus saccharophilus]
MEKKPVIKPVVRPIGTGHEQNSADKPSMTIRPATTVKPKK